MAITWTKEWQASDDGTIISGLDLKNIQDDITSGSTGDATSLWSIAINQPTAADDGKLLYYDHGLSAYDWYDPSDILPSGIILLWSGTIATIPSGWYLCNGSNGTPNLTDRFVIHADYDSGGSGTIEQGTSGGSRTITSANLPPHTHTYTKSNQAGASTADGVSGSPHRDSGNVTTNTSNGGFANDDFLPKYYALAYIMKG